MAYLVDTNIMVDLTRGNAKADYLDSLGDGCLLSAITALELIAGARSQHGVADLDFMISAYDQVPPTDDITRRAY
jgi:predicted nucleic acid-binding protein